MEDRQLGRPFSTVMTTSLFNDDTGTPYTQEADFFSTIGTLCSVILDNIQTTHQHHAHDCSIVATFQHRGSSAASESLMVNPFGIYHLMGGIDYSELVLKALVLEDFGSAASYLSMLHLVPGC